MDFALQIEANIAERKLNPLQLYLIQNWGKKLFLGRETRPDWTGYLPFYLFWCGVCMRFAKDYPHGWHENQYLNCSNCGAKYPFVPWWMHWRIKWENLKIRIRYGTLLTISIIKEGRKK